MDQRADRLHHRARHQVGGHRGERQDVEEEDEHRRHQRPAAHAGETDDDADTEGGDRERKVEAHAETMLGVCFTQALHKTLHADVPSGVRFCARRAIATSLVSNLEWCAGVMRGTRRHEGWDFDHRSPGDGGQLWLRTRVRRKPMTFLSVSQGLGAGKSRTCGRLARTGCSTIWRTAD